MLDDKSLDAIFRQARTHNGFSGTVSDAQTPAGALSVTQVAGGSATGISVGNVGNSNGTITATLAAGCAATWHRPLRSLDGALAGHDDPQA
jgi:hypothetical protein